MLNVNTHKQTIASVGQMVYETAAKSSKVFQEIQEQKAEERRREEAERLRETARNERSPEVIVDVQSVSVEETSTEDTSSETFLRGDIVDLTT
jgi:hypothetical protein